jgi:hypothetical protein
VSAQVAPLDPEAADEAKGVLQPKEEKRGQEDGQYSKSTLAWPMAKLRYAFAPHA